MTKIIEAEIDFNGAFLYAPNGIKLSGKNIHFTITGAYILIESLDEAKRALNSRKYKKWKESFKNLIGEKTN